MSDPIAGAPTPAQIYQMTLDELYAVRDDLADEKWDARLETATDQEKQDFADLIGEVADRIRDLSNASLANLAAKLTANEPALSAGVTASKDARKKFDTVAGAIKGFSQLLGAVASLLKFAAKL